MISYLVRIIFYRSKCSSQNDQKSITFQKDVLMFETMNMVISLQPLSMQLRNEATTFVARF